MRHKSKATMQLERDRAIRKERRKLKRREREAKREVRLKRRLTHESVMRNGVPKVQSGGAELGIRDAIALNPWRFCESCGRLVKEKELERGDLCPACYFEWDKTKGGENSAETKPKQQGDKGLPLAGERGLKPEVLAGQLSLKL